MRRKGRLPMLAAGGLVFGLGAAWAASSLLAVPPEAAPPPAPAAAKSTAASNDEIDLGEVDIEGESDSDVTGNNKLSSCIASYLPKKTFDKAPDLSWVCSMESPRKGADKMRVAVVTHSPGKQVSSAMKLFSRMGWYDMVLYSVLRSGCCQEAAPLALPNPSPGCERMDNLLSSIGKQVVDGQPFEESLESFTKTVQCEVKAGNAAAFNKRQGPGGGEKEAFIEYTQGLN